MISLILGDPWPRSSLPPSCHWGQTVILGACTHWAKPRGLFPAQLPWLQAGAQPPRTEPCGPGRARCLTHGFLSLRKLGAKVFPQSILREHSYPVTAQEQGAHSRVGT